MKKLFKAREMTAFLFLVALFLVVGVINPDFLRGGENIAACFNGAIVYILVAVGMAFPILIGEIDVSVGSNLGLVAAVVGYACIRLLKMIAEKGRFGFFAYYCWLAGAVTLALTLLQK